jgi:hypothetical protein
MFDEPSEGPVEPLFNPVDRAREKSIEFCMHAELAAVFEGCRKFDAELLPGLDANLAREIQRKIGRLEKSKSPDSPVLPEPSYADAAAVLDMPVTAQLSTNDYHINRRPGEVMMIRWLAGDQVEAFYERLQAHFDAAMGTLREEQRQDHQWKQDPETLAYIKALEAADVKMADRHLRHVIRLHRIFVMSTQTADEMNIAYLADYVMGVSAAQIVGTNSAPPDEPEEKDLAWFFKLFSLRGIHEGVEKMCFFTFLQKADDDSWD